jgi:hypothetical protein
METFTLRHAGGYEVASDGQRPIGRDNSGRYGLLKIGRDLIAERARADREGRPYRKLTRIELRALLAVEEADIEGAR